MKTYQGTRTGINEQNTAGDAIVSVREYNKTRILKPSSLAIRKSPTGFNWGYGGSGPAALAHSVLFDLFQDEEQADEMYLQFKQDIIAQLDQESNWELPEEQIHSWANKWRGSIS